MEIAVRYGYAAIFGSLVRALTKWASDREGRLTQGCRGYEISHPYPHPQTFRGYPWIYPYPQMPILCKRVSTK